MGIRHFVAAAIVATAAFAAAAQDMVVYHFDDTASQGLKGLRHLDLRGTAVGRLAADVPQWFEHLEYLGLPKGAVGLFGRLGMPRRVTLELGDAPAS